MADPVSGNLAMLMQVVNRLAPLLDRFVFLGGVVTELLITSTAAGSPRQTKDVDVVVNVLNLGEYSETLRERFLACGLVEDKRPGAPVCRWCLDDLIVDIMPTRGEILDFSCEWYQVAFDTAQPTMLPNGSTIRLVTPACFLATKLAAFGDRGRRDAAQPARDAAAARGPQPRRYAADAITGRCHRRLGEPWLRSKPVYMRGLSQPSSWPSKPSPRNSSGSRPTSLNA